MVCLKKDKEGIKERQTEIKKDKRKQRKTNRNKERQTETKTHNENRGTRAEKTRMS